MALVSPGVSITINDQSQYVASNVGSVPLVILATAQDKSYNGAYASGTSKSSAGKLQSFTSQRDLVTAFGTPSFQLSSAGTPVNGSELNEYGLLTAYSALGLGNQLYAIRADVDLAGLTGTGVRPHGAVANGTYWMNLAASDFGIYESDAATESFNSIAGDLLLITDAAQVYNNSGVYTPLASVGQQGAYALVFTDTAGADVSTIRLFYKASATSTAGGTTGATANLANTWVQVGSSDWQRSVVTLQGTKVPGQGSNPALIGTSTFVINGQTVTTGGSSSTVLQVANVINTAAIPGVTATASNGLLTFFVTSSASSNGIDADGKLVVTDGTGSPLFKCGVVAASTNGTATAYCPYFFYGTYAQEPSQGWFGTTPRPSGSVWWKTTSTGQGWSPMLNQYNANLGAWNQLSVPLYTGWNDAIYALDPVGGGGNIPAGQLIALYGVYDATSNSLQFAMNMGGPTTVGTGAAPTSFSAGKTFTIQATQPGQATLTDPVPVTTSGTTALSFVSDILNANVPYVTAELNTNGTISVTHTLGGAIALIPGSGSSLTVLSNAGFVNASSNSVIGLSNGLGTIIITNFEFITADITYSVTAPYSAPANGTLWYYSNSADVDVMINNNGWKGYRNVTADIRGYNLSLTDPNGVIVSAGQPTTQSDGVTTVKAGDIWLDSSDLINYPKLYRYTGAAWVAIDNTDHVSNSGIVFADARWDGTGTTDVIGGSFPAISSLLTSNYTDLDCPDYRLYPRGTLLFNTRRSGYNVKKFVRNYFNTTSFPNKNLPDVADTWVSDSGLNENGVMNAGSAAQRAIVVAAMASAVNSNTDIIEDNYNFNLLVAPGYPELIPELVTLNDNRGDTGFVIGDTPMTLTPTSTDLISWNNNSGAWAGKGLATASPYLGVYYPAGLTTDLSGHTVAVPASYAALRTFLYNDNVSYQWFAPAGVHRGLVSNLNDIGYINKNTGAFVHNGINQGLRDSLYTLKINPIVQLPGVGLVVWGQETRSGDSTARNRVNVVRLENYLRTIFKTISNGYLFEPNDTITRKSIASQIESALHNILSKRGVYDFLVICDTSNNTSSTIANNQLYVDVAIEPMKDVEFIYIPVALYNPGSIAQLGAAST